MIVSEGGNKHFVSVFACAIHNDGCPTRRGVPRVGAADSDITWHFVIENPLTPSSSVPTLRNPRSVGSRCEINTVYH